MLHNDWFDALDDILDRHQALWRASPFRDPEGFRRSLDPRRQHLLDSLPQDSLPHLQRCDEALMDALHDAFPVAEIRAALAPLGKVPAQPSPRVTALEEAAMVAVPGRKLSQIRHFADALGRLDLPLLEWCAGKAHLGRALHRLSGQPVTALELRPELVAQGRALASAPGLDQPGKGVSCHSQGVDLQCADVLAALPPRWFAAPRQAVALHACGDLHRRLLEVGVSHRLQRISLAPCCYQKTAQTSYQPLSHHARRSRLDLSRDDLHSAVRAPITLSASEDRQRRRLRAWRLGFDLLRRALCGAQGYQPLPSLPLSAARLDFAGFCTLAAARTGLALPPHTAFAEFAARGQQRSEEVERLELVGSLFRRCLELWLVIDLALFLEEQGYQCHISQFCPASVTPRNLLLDARLPGPSTP